MDRYAIIGYPLEHSASPRIHNTAFKEYGMDAVYEKLEIDPQEFDAAIGQIKKEDWRGFNVTIPHKQRIMNFLDKIDPAAERIGAVNTVKAEPDGGWAGYNTDYSGFLHSLQEYRKEIRTCLLMGAGGAARAVAFAVCDLPQIEFLCLMNRRLANSRALREELALYKSIRYRVAETENDTAGMPYDLIINATPVGMGELKTSLPLDPRTYAHQTTIVYDLIYNPAQTLFLQRAKEAGLRTVNGWPMLLGQAEEAFRIWTGRGFTKEVVKKIERIF